MHPRVNRSQTDVHFIKHRKRLLFPQSVVSIVRFARCFGELFSTYIYLVTSQKTWGPSVFHRPGLAWHNRAIHLLLWVAEPFQQTLGLTARHANPLQQRSGSHRTARETLMVRYACGPLFKTFCVLWRCHQPLLQPSFSVRWRRLVHHPFPTSTPLNQTQCALRVAVAQLCTNGWCAWL